MPFDLKTTMSARTDAPVARRRRSGGARAPRASRAGRPQRARSGRLTRALRPRASRSRQARRAGAPACRARGRAGSFAPIAQTSAPRRASPRAAQGPGRGRGDDDVAAPGVGPASRRPPRRCLGEGRARSGDRLETTTWASDGTAARIGGKLRLRLPARTDQPEARRARPREMLRGDAARGAGPHLTQRVGGDQSR